MRLLRLLLIAFLATGLVVAIALWFVTAPRPLGETALATREPDRANGERLFWAGGCASCHAAPNAGDPLRLAGGLALVTPFGTFKVPNISPHREAGIGAWSALAFVNAMTRGIAPGDKHYYPAFPYPSYRRMPVADVLDLFAYLKTLPEVPTPSQEHELGFPFSIRRGLGLWKMLYFDEGVFQPDPARDAAWNRGAYLVQGPGHCGECHTPRDAFGGPILERAYSGGPAPVGTGSIPNITPAPDGLGPWSHAEIVEVLTTGFTPEFDSVGGPMAEVVRTLARLPASDREAIAVYLKTLPPRQGAAQVAK